MKKRKRGLLGLIWADLRGEKKYFAEKRTVYRSERYGKAVTVQVGYWSDGATHAIDIKNSISWWVHDVLCDRGTWDDHTPCSKWQASTVLSDILAEEGRSIRSVTWRFSTFLIGGGNFKSWI